MEETFQSNTLDWSSLVLFPFFFSTSFSIHNFVNVQPIDFKFSAYDQND